MTKLSGVVAVAIALKNKKPVVAEFRLGGELRRQVVQRAIHKRQFATISGTFNAFDLRADFYVFETVIEASRYIRDCPQPEKEIA